jgi:hypothetical protein
MHHEDAGVTGGRVYHVSLLLCSLTYWNEFNIIYEAKQTLIKLLRFQLYQTDFLFMTTRDYYGKPSPTPKYIAKTKCISTNTACRILMVIITQDQYQWDPLSESLTCGICRELAKNYVQGLLRTIFAV